MPYIAEHCSPFEPSDNVIIYGHHMKNGTMFTGLMDYESRKFYEGHKTIHFDTLTKTADYEVIAVFKTTVYDDTGFKYYLFANAETEEDFQETLDLMRTVGFDASFMFKYSERPGTLASRQMPDNVPEEVKIERLNRMIALQNELSAASNIRDRGHVFEVLVEGVAKRSHEQMVGRTSQNKTAVFPRGNAKVGEFVKVRVLDSSSATLICELAD